MTEDEGLWINALHESRRQMLSGEVAQKLLLSVNDVFEGRNCSLNALTSREIYEVLSNIRSRYQHEVDSYCVKLFIHFWEKRKCEALVLLTFLSGNELLSEGGQTLLDCLKEIHLAPFIVQIFDPTARMSDDSGEEDKSDQTFVLHTDNVSTRQLVYETIHICSLHLCPRDMF
jgi:hypothetical protein